MRTLVLVVLLVGAVACKGSSSSKSSSTSSSHQHVARAGDVAIVGATIRPMTTPKETAALVDHVVLIRGDKIVTVAPANDVDVKAARVVDAKGAWVVPGLADMHVHLRGETDFKLFLLNGVTAVRDLFGSPDHVKWRDDIAAGKLAGPTITTAGPIIDGEGATWPGSDIVKTADDAREVVKRQKAAGYDVLKVYNKIPADAYAALVAEAKLQGMPVMGHVPDAVGVAGVLASGQRTIEHLDGYVPFQGTPVVDEQIVAATAKADIWNSATLVVTARVAALEQPETLKSLPGMQYVRDAQLVQWDPKHDFRFASWTPERFADLRAKNEIRKKLVGDLARAGGKLVLGTDANNPYVIPGFAVHDELALLVASGVSPYEALRAATANAAAMLGTPGAFGTIQPGARADLLVVARDPIADLKALAEPSLVMVRGKEQTRAALLAAAEAATKVADPFADLPAIETEGEKLYSAQYDVLLGTAKLGAERAIVSKIGATKTSTTEKSNRDLKVVRGQASFSMPMKAVYHYRATADSLEQWSAPDASDKSVTKRVGTKATTTLPSGPPLELAVAADAIVAPQTIATFVWHADRLADLKPQGKRTITTAELVVEGATTKLVPANYDYVRAADAANGHRVYSFAGKHEQMTMKGTLEVDAKTGRPERIEIVVPFGTISMTRTGD